MIVSASYRTDIPAFYGAWFASRLAAGECYVRNPYGGAPYRVNLGIEAVDGFVFWTRNPRPFLPVLDQVAARSQPFMLQTTITGYPRALDRHVRPPAQVISALDKVVRQYGPDVVVWRYDPILFADQLTAAWHRQNFARLAEGLRLLTNEVVVSFAHFYAKSIRNLAAANIAWRDPSMDEKRALLADLAEIAGNHGLALTVCSQSDLAVAPAARCIDARRLARIAGRPIVARTKGNRPGCLCAESRDIGVYNSCIHGCTYCYAVRSPNAALAARASHTPIADRL